MSCIFCNIVKKREPSAKIYEDEFVIAFLDKAQITKGHTLVIPKQHYRNILAMEDELVGKLFQSVAKVSKQLKLRTDALGINIVSNNEAGAEQVVFHTHVHLIPRYKDDGIRMKSKEHYVSFEELYKLSNKLRI